MTSCLFNPCKYSFNDLIIASNSKDISVEYLMTLSQTNLNNTIKKLCAMSNWFYEDVTGKNGVIYTSFSKYRK